MNKKRAGPSDSSREDAAKPSADLGGAQVGAPEATDLTDDDSSAPLMPHERDQTVDTTGGEPSERVQQGAEDLKRGVQDTSRADESGKAYRKLKR